MSKLIWILPFALSAGCVVENRPPPAPPASPPTAAAAAQPAFVEPPAPGPTNERIPWSAADGRPSELRSGVAESFWVWHDGRGKNWHVRTSTARYMHQFSGWTVADTGQLTEFHLARADMGDRIRLDTRGISFDYHTQAEEEGYDFQTSGDHCVKFDLRIDGQSHPERVFVGHGNVHPQHGNFMLCP